MVDRLVGQNLQSYVPKIGQCHHRFGAGNTDNDGRSEAL